MAYLVFTFHSPRGDLTFSASTATNFTGYRLLSYQPGMNAENARAVDTIVCDICGAGADDAMSKLRALKSFFYYAQSDIDSEQQVLPPQLEFRPEGTTASGYSIVYGGTVSEGVFDSNTPKGVISGVVITLSREPFWRGLPPQWGDAPLADPIITPSTGTTTGNVDGKGSLSVAGVPGDLPALVHLKFGPITGIGAPADTYYFGYASARYSPTSYSSFGATEAESATLGASTTSVADAAADNGNAAQMTGVGSEAVALYTNNGFILGTFRVFARVRCSAGASDWRLRASMRQFNGSNLSDMITYSAATSVSVTSTSYVLFDLGVIQSPTWAPSYDQPSTAWSFRLNLLAYRVSGAANLLIDWLYIMPVHEGYLRIDFAQKNFGAVVYDNIFAAPRYTAGAYEMRTTIGRTLQPLFRVLPQLARGSMRFAPGDGYFYWLASSNLGASNRYRLQLAYVKLFNSPRGSA